MEPNDEATEALSELTRIAERYELALRRIMGTRECEHSTVGIGSCFRGGRTTTARYLSDRACDPCIAHKALGWED